MAAQPLPHHIELWPIERLVEYPRNPRKNHGAVERMCASIREFGFKIPCLVRGDGEIVDGHLRLKAARKLGISEIPVILCDEWTPVQVKAFRLMFNPLGDVGRVERRSAEPEIARIERSRLRLRFRIPWSRYDLTQKQVEA